MTFYVPTLSVCLLFYVLFDVFHSSTDVTSFRCQTVGPVQNAQGFFIEPIVTFQF